MGLPDIADPAPAVRAARLPDQRIEDEAPPVGRYRAGRGRRDRRVARRATVARRVGIGALAERRLLGLRRRDRGGRWRVQRALAAAAGKREGRAQRGERREAKQLMTMTEAPHARPPPTLAPSTSKV